jgi:hypothetical protein
VRPNSSLSACSYGVAHVVDDFSWSVDDAVGVGYIGGEALEELFLDGVEEILLFGEMAQVGAFALDGFVVWVKVLKGLRREKAPLASASITFSTCAANGVSTREFGGSGRGCASGVR